MDRLNGNQRGAGNGNYAKVNSTGRAGNLSVHYHRGPDGKLIQIVRPPFVKIK